MVTYNKVDLQGKNLEDELFKRSHYQTRGYAFKEFIKELKETGAAQRNQGGTKFNVYFTAMLKGDILYTKMSAGNVRPPFTFGGLED